MHPLKEGPQSHALRFGFLVLDKEISIILRELLLFLSFFHRRLMDNSLWTGTVSVETAAPESKRPNLESWAKCLNSLVVMGRIELPTYGL